MARVGIVTLFLLASCNLIPRAVNTDQSPATARPSPVDTATEEAAEEAAEAAALQAECEDQIEDLLDTLREIDSRLNIGVQFDDYLDLVGDARVEYDGTDFDEMDVDCLQEVGVPAEAALRKYAQAAGVWNRCIGNFGCSNDEIEPTLQRQWAAASAQIAKAEEGLDDLGEA